MTNTLAVEALIESILPRLQALTGPNSTGNYSSRCPLHKDRHASFSLHARTGLWQCHASGCGRRGNAFQLANELGVVDPAPRPARALDWRLDAAMAKYGIKVNHRGVVFPVHDHTGERGRDHVRLHSGNPRFQYWGQGRTLHALVEWELVREWGSSAGIAYIVEGNRDWLSLAAFGWPAVGILGTEHFARAREESFDHIRRAGIGAFVITPDNDPPGQLAARQWARVLTQDGFLVGMRILPTTVNGALIKDVFDLYRAVGDDFSAWLHELPVRWRDSWTT